MTTMRERLEAEAEAADKPPVERPRTLADISDEPPPALVLGLLEPNGPNLIYGHAGVGKGLMGVYIIRGLLELDYRVLVYDAEDAAQEWSSRLSGLAGADARGDVDYLQPDDLPENLQGKPLERVWPHIAEVAALTGAGAVVIDSLSAAMNMSAEDMRADLGAPHRYRKAARATGLLTLALGHTPGNANNSTTANPYGSVGWRQAMRMAWLLTTVQHEDNRYTLRLTNTKANVRAQLPPKLALCEFAADGRPMRFSVENEEVSTRQWLLNALVAGPRLTQDLVTDRLDEMSEPDTEQTRKRESAKFRSALKHLKADGLVSSSDAGKETKWTLKPAKEDEA